MARKTKTMHLEYQDTYAAPPFNGEPCWVVKKVTDSIEFAPGERLKKTQVGPLCADTNWSITITNMK